jgi:hypothetical protein
MSKRVPVRESRFAEASFYIGLFSLAEEFIAVGNINFVAVIIGAVLSAAAIVFGILGLKQVKKEKMEGKWLAITGIVFGGIGVAVIPFYLLVWVPAINKVLLEKSTAIIQ